MLTKIRSGNKVLKATPLLIITLFPLNLCVFRNNSKSKIVQNINLLRLCCTNTIPDIVHTFE